MPQRTRDLGAVAFALVFALGAFALGVGPAARGEPTAASATAFYAIDGDTLEDRRSGERIRLANIDTPETGDRARCGAERELGERATARARAILAGARRLDLRRSGRRDIYDRAVARLIVDGRDLGEQLVAEGLARTWRGRREPWCDRRGNLLPS